MNRLKRQELTQEDLPQLYSHLRLAHPLTDKEPFFPKSYRQSTVARRMLWPLARSFAPATLAYRAAYSPRASAPVVFKEVTFVRPLQNIIWKTDIPVIYLVRHPCATVLSEVHGQRQGKMPAGRQQRLYDVLRQHAPELAERFGEICAGSDVVSRAALLWRCEVEACYSAVRSSPRGLVMTYEQLASDAHRHTKAMFDHLGLAYSEQTATYIEALYGLPGAERRWRRTGWGDRYFSVHRNPRQEKDAWKDRISADDRLKIEQIVRDSPVVSFGAAQGEWA
jgi:hypothetical protein